MMMTSKEMITGWLDEIHDLKAELAASEAREKRLRKAAELALTYIEDGAPLTAADRLRAALAEEPPDESKDP